MPNISDKQLQAIEKIRQGLKRHWGAMDEVAKRANVDRTYAYRVLKGRHVNAAVLEAASAVLIEREQRAAELRTLVRDTLDTVESLRPIHPQVKAIAG